MAVLGGTELAAQTPKLARTGVAMVRGEAMGAEVVAAGTGAAGAINRTRIPSTQIYSQLTAERISTYSRMPERKLERGIHREQSNNGLEHSLSGHSIREINLGLSSSGRTMNCANCAIATDATLAGRPTSALPGQPTTALELARYYGKSQFNWIERSGIDAITETMYNWGNGSRGILWGYRGENNIGHFSNVVNQNGHIRFLDGQIGAPTKLNDGYTRFFIMRTDK